jgi:hypothetical protein
MMHRTTRGGAAIVAVLLLLGGCSSPTPEPSGAPPTDDTNPYGGFPIDPPAPDEVVLTATGSDTVDWTYAELQERASVEYTMTEPFVLRTETFAGVPLALLAEEAGIAADATVTTIALNGYSYADSLSAFVESDALIAVFRDGAPIPMDEGGPIRIVFPEGSAYYEFLDAWNWSLRSIESDAAAP